MASNGLRPNVLPGKFAFSDTGGGLHDLGSPDGVLELFLKYPGIEARLMFPLTWFLGSTSKHHSGKCDMAMLTE